MTPRQIMVIAGEASGDMLAAELVLALRQALLDIDSRVTTDAQPLFSTLRAQFFGAGGPRMAEAGVELEFDLAQHAVIGLVLRKYLKFRQLFGRLLRMAIRRKPALIILVDFSGFNRRFAHAIRRELRARRGPFSNWQPRLVQFVSPQVWASRENRVYQVARDYDLLLSIFPFEKDWYARRVPDFPVAFVGHPMVDRYAGQRSAASQETNPPTLLLLPGSRPAELQRHLPVMIGAAQRIRAELPVVLRIVLPSETLVTQAREHVRGVPAVEVYCGPVSDALSTATVAIASTGTVTMECAYFGVPTVTLYKTSWTTYQLGKRLIKVPSLTMPNLLAREPVFPEFIQDAATSENIAREALELLRDEERRSRIKTRLAVVVESLGPVGAPRRAAEEIVKLLASSEASASRSMGSGVATAPSGVS